VWQGCGLELSGQNTDLDKGILDALSEPLMHLVRNALTMDRTAGERLTAGKPARGTVYLNAYHRALRSSLKFVTTAVEWTLIICGRKPLKRNLETRRGQAPDRSGHP